jgi:hypothetical protein
MTHVSICIRIRRYVGELSYVSSGTYVMRSSYERVGRYHRIHSHLYIGECTNDCLYYSKLTANRYRLRLVLRSECPMHTFELSIQQWQADWPRSIMFSLVPPSGFMSPKKEHTLASYKNKTISGRFLSIQLLRNVCAIYDNAQESDKYDHRDSSNAILNFARAHLIAQTRCFRIGT